MSGVLELAELFGSFQKDRDNGDAQVLAARPSPAGSLTPGSIGPKLAPAAESKAPSKSSSASKKDIWDDDEVEENVLDDADPRPAPEYTIKYRQRVTSEDIYLQMGGKTPSTSHTDDLVVTIQLPGEQLKDVELTCTPNKLEVRSPKFRLVAPLPRTVKDKDGAARFDAAKGELVVTMPVVPEFL
ncbi:hypothetical protein DFJ73DRAFT_831593 [Zopfochytrium polystomum]|nr:hypothetical protein DFJ73DRAFT_831593 [Zopfochytrium polystomum]